VRAVGLHRAHPTPRLSRRTGRVLVAGALAVASATGGVLVAQTASAAVPVFPDNLLVFPDRDFISIEGYQDHVGEKATVTLTRGGVKVGEAVGTVGAGDVAFEINHPGGICWGAGAAANMQVTPNVVKGDVVAITFADGTSDDTTVGSGVASDAVLDPDGVTVTVKGSIGPEINPDFIEQRIINPDLVPVIGKRDVRAVPGPLVAAPRGGYSSGLTVDPAAADGSRTVTATYVFDTPEAASLAANAPLGERLMSWQVQDPAGNRQGLTIAEFGEAGGPGFGGCPLGPADSTPQAGTVTVVPSADKTSARLTWSPATAAAGASPVTNYSVLAIAPVAAGALNGQQSQVGLRFNQDARSADVTGLDANASYIFEVRAITADGKASAPFTVNTANPGGGTQTPGAVPQLTLTPAPNPDGVTAVQTNSVTATTTAGTQIFVAADTPVFAGGVLTDAAQPVTGPIPITKPTTLHFAAVNSANNVETVTGVFAPAAATTPATPTGVGATGGQLSATVRWTNATSGVTGYEIVMTRPDGTTATQTAAASPVTINNLTAGDYKFTVAAVNGTLKSAPSAQVTATVTRVTDTVGITKATWKTGDFRVVGTSTATGGTVTIREGSATGRILIASVPITPAVAPATGGDFDGRVRSTAAPATKPASVFVISSNGGTAGPFPVSG
jgi:hypothetical protein